MRSRSVQEYTDHDMSRHASVTGSVRSAAGVGIADTFGASSRPARGNGWTPAR